MQMPSLELQFDRGHASFALKLDATRRLGNAFDRYEELLGSPQGLPSPEGSPTEAGVATFFHCAKVRVLSESQKFMLDWILTNQDSLVDTIGHLIRLYYCSPQWAGWKPGDFSGRAAPPPTIPGGYSLEDFIRISAIFLNPNACTFGVAIETAWFSEGGLGLRFTDFVNSDIGEDTYALV